MAQNVTLLGASYSAVPAVTLPKTGGGTAKFTDVSDTTASASDVAQGKYFYNASGVRTAGTSSGGGGGGAGDVAVATAEPISGSVHGIIFGELNGQPTSFAVMLATNGLSPSEDPVIVGVVYDGTDLHAQTITNTSNAQVSYSTDVSMYYSYGNLSISTEALNFYSEFHDYMLVYTYDGSSSDIHTASVQVGSGATSITFSGLAGNPIYWSCIFKSNFGTSSGYQRVIEVVNDGASGIYGLEMDSSAKSAQHWTATYSNGSLTISSNGTNQGGYFHQPGYYQLTYVADPNSSSGGGESNMNVQTVQGTSRTANTTLTSLLSLTCAVAGTYDVYWTCARSNTSNTWQSQLYLGGTAYGSVQSTWSNHVQTVKLTGVQISANQTVEVYGRSRGSSYYIYATQLTIVQTS